MGSRVDAQGYNTKVTRLGDGYGVRLLRHGKVVAQDRADDRSGARLALRELLRWEDKLGGTSDMAHASRRRP